MSWSSASSTIAGYDIYIQSDSDWVARPNIATHTPIEADESIFQFVNSPASTRVITGYMDSKSDVDDLVASCKTGASALFVTPESTASVIITEVRPNRQYAANVSYLALVSITMSEYS